MTAPATTIETPAAAQWRTALAALLIGLLALRIIGLVAARTDLFFDEAQYWTWSRDVAFGYFSKPPMIAWIIRAATDVCGESEACIRAPAPILYAITAALLFFCARPLFGARVAAAAAIVFATLPGVSFSSGQISTDVPLLLFWTLALLAWTRLLATGALRWAALLGLAFGCGMLAKYAMAFFALCAVVHLACSREARRSTPPSGILLAALLAAAILAPHILWNMRTGFVTLAHTADNADWTGRLFHPGNLLEFLAAQFGVFGPILTVALLAIAWRSMRRGANEPERFLLAFSLPVLALIGVQALISRAHANWAATAYPAAAILVTAALLQERRRGLFGFSLALHAAAALALAVAPAFAPLLRLPGGLDPYGRLLGWRQTADAVRDELSRRPYATILTDDRQLTAELLYYLRGTAVPVREWRATARPRDQYQMTIPFPGPFQDPFPGPLRGEGGPVLLVAQKDTNPAITGRFGSAETVATLAVADASGRGRTVRLTRLADYAGPQS